MRGSVGRRGCVRAAWTGAGGWEGVSSASHLLFSLVVQSGTWEALIQDASCSD